MNHKKSCFGRTFKQYTQTSDPDGKSWSDDNKFYENLHFKGKGTQAKHSGIMFALDNACKTLNGSNLMPDFNKSEYYGPNINPLTHHGYSSNPGNCWNQDWITEPWK
jgi:hypothetical protein